MLVDNLTKEELYSEELLAVKAEVQRAKDRLVRSLSGHTDTPDTDTIINLAFEAGIKFAILHVI